MGSMLRKWKVFGMGKSDPIAIGLRRSWNIFLPSLESSHWECNLAFHEFDAYKVEVADTFASGQEVGCGTRFL